MKNTSLLIIVFIFTSIQTSMAKGNQYDFIIGTYTNNTQSKGIYTLHCDFENSKFETKIAADNVFDPSYLALAPDKKFVYSISERGDKSTISSFYFDNKTGSMSFLNRVAGQGADPCFVSVSKNHVITANYTGGNVCVFGRNTDGTLTNAVQNVQHTGKSIDANRQDKPHVHQAIFSPDQKSLLVNDLGTDFITSYSYDKKSANKVLTEFDKLKVKAGSGPRHLAFSKNGAFIYLLQEMDGTVSIIAYNKGKLSLIEETTVVRRDNISSGAADIHISPDGKFLYATNRGNANDITAFGILNGGKLKFVQQISVLGIGPRNFTITKDGKYILVANQKSNQIVVFGRNKKTGELKETGIKIDLPSPVCLVQY